MYRQFQKRLTDSVRAYLEQQHQITVEKIVLEQPPNVGFGEYAMPLAFEANAGQSADGVDFLARGSGYALFLSASGAQLTLHGGAPAGHR